MTGHRLDPDGYCTMSDLPESQCAAPQCRPDLTHVDETATRANETLLPSQIITRTRARHVSIMACGHHGLPETIIALSPMGWVCTDCDPGEAPADPAGDPLDGLDARDAVTA